MEKFLRDLYKKFLKFDRSYFFRDARTWLGVGQIKLNKKILKEFYENHEKVSFLEFLSDVKSIIYSKNVFDFIVKESEDDWTFWYYLRFLEKERVIKIKKNGKVSLLKKEIEEIIPKPQDSKEIKRNIEKRLKLKARDKAPIINLFKKFQDFKVKGRLDQMPISTGSAFFVVEKILKCLPKNKKFLFVGDDDFISIILSLANPRIESLVIDTDEELLSCIDSLALRFNLKIETRKVDTRTQKSLGEKFIGFLTNPIYTVAGVKEFIKFGKKQLSKDGGIVFLELGEGAIGNRLLFLQDFFARNNLIIEELILNKIYYPYIMLHKEDKEIIKRLSLMFNKRIVKKSPRLGAALYVFRYLPLRPRKIKFKMPIYTYL